MQNTGAIHVDELDNIIKFVIFATVIDAAELDMNKIRNVKLKLPLAIKALQETRSEAFKEYSIIHNKLLKNDIQVFKQKVENGLDIKFTIRGCEYWLLMPSDYIKTNVILCANDLAKITRNSYE